MSHAEALFNKALSFYRSKKLLDAKKCLLEASELVPDNAQVSEFLAHILYLLGENNPARIHFEAAIRNSVRGPTTNLLYQYSKVMLDLGDYEGTLKRGNDLIAGKPDFAPGWQLLGECYSRRLKMSKAAYYFERASELKPKDYSILRSLSTCYHSLCLWDKAEEVDGRLTEIALEAINAGGVSPLTFHAAMIFVTDGALIKKIAVNQALGYEKIQVSTGISLPPAKKKRSHERIRLGYFSINFSKHATAGLVQDQFRHHDKGKFEIFGYAINADPSCRYYKKISSSIENFKALNSKNDLELATIIQDDELDILIDLDGVVGHSRRGVFSLRPAPIQINWLGTPATSGAPWFDYILSDNIVSPPELEEHYSEKILRMPDSYFFNSFTSIELDETEKSDFGLPEDKFIFASFNFNRKIDRASFHAWCDILIAVNDSVLWILIDDDETYKILQQELVKRGIDPERLIAADRVKNTQHISRLVHADLMLDCFICGAHTTCVEALWAELPVLTKIGEPFYSRVAASILNAADMQSCITYSVDEYIKRAIEIAQEPEQLQKLKGNLKNNKKRLPLFDQKKWVQDFETQLLSLITN